MHTLLDQLAAELWDFGLENAPSSATLLGDHRFDHMIEDLSPEHEADQRAALVRFVEQAEMIDPAELGSRERVTRSVLIAQCSQMIDSIDSEMTEMSCDQLTSPHAALLRTAAQWSFPEPEHAEALIERLRKIPTALEQAMGRFRTAVKKGRPPARITVLRSLSILDGYLASPLERDIFVLMHGPQSWAGEADWRERLRSTVREEVRPGFQRYRDGFETESGPARRRTRHRRRGFGDAGVESLGRDEQRPSSCLGGNYGLGSTTNSYSSPAAAHASSPTSSTMHSPAIENR